MGCLMTGLPAGQRLLLLSLCTVGITRCHGCNSDFTGSADKISVCPGIKLKLKAYVQRFQQTQGGLGISGPTSFPAAAQTCTARPDSLLGCVCKRGFTPRKERQNVSRSPGIQRRAGHRLGLRWEAPVSPLVMLLAGQFQILSSCSGHILI